MAIPRVLLVEDEVDLNATLVELLEEEGYRVHSTHALHEARAAFEAFEPDTVVVDYLIHGEASAEWVEQIAERAGVVMISATASAREHAEQNGFAFLAKPFDIDELLQVLSRVSRLL